MLWTSLLVVFVLGGPASAAGGDAGDVEVSVFAGWCFPDDYGDGVAAANPDDDLLYGGRIGWFVTPAWSVEFTAQRLETETRLALSLPDVDFELWSARYNALRGFRLGERLRPFVAFGFGIETVDVSLPGPLAAAGRSIDDNDIGVNVGGGARWFLGERFGLRFDGRLVAIDLGGDLDTQQNVEATVGATWAFGGAPPSDADGDGVRDRRDECPDTPRGAVVDATGCPIDSDGDGVPDGLDKCPDTPQGMAVDAEGCPKDTDGDGVNDALDRCPDTPSGATVDGDGCPADSDGDGVYDGIDRCPDTPAGARVDATGCPTDEDGDGVWDGIDKCPDSPRGAPVDASGCTLDSDGDGVHDGADRCPDTPRGNKVDVRGCELVFEEQTQTLVLEGVNFEFDSAVLTPEAKAILDRMAQALKEWPEIEVEVAGHTDSKGSDAYNLELSKARARSVRDYLVERGVPTRQLTATGYGESVPKADNATDFGREINRRVELRKTN
jgi:outer membrane protein OmpA-like peptidoglycan-associated protein